MFETIVAVCFVTVGGETDCSQVVRDEATCHEVAGDSVSIWNKAVLSRNGDLNEMVSHYFCAEGRKWGPDKSEQPQ